MNIKGICFVWKQKVYQNLVEAQKEKSNYVNSFLKKLNMSLINKTAYFYIENWYLKLPSDIKHTYKSYFPNKVLKG